MKMTRRAMPKGSRLRMAKNSSPERPGMRRSETTASKVSPRRTSSAAWAQATSATWKPWRCGRKRRTPCGSRASSTRRTRWPAPKSWPAGAAARAARPRRRAPSVTGTGALGRRGEHDAEHGTAFGARGHGDVAALRADEALGDGQAEAGPLAGGLGGEVGAEDGLAQLLGGSGAVVLDADDDAIGAVRRQCQADGAEAAAGGDGLLRVHDEVEQHLPGWLASPRKRVQSG